MPGAGHTAQCLPGERGHHPDDQRRQRQERGDDGRRAGEPLRGECEADGSGQDGGREGTAGGVGPGQGGRQHDRRRQYQHAGAYDQEQGQRRAKHRQTDREGVRDQGETVAPQREVDHRTHGECHRGGPARPGHGPDGLRVRPAGAPDPPPRVQGRRAQGAAVRGRETRVRSPTVLVVPHAPALLPAPVPALVLVPGRFGRGAVGAIRRGQRGQTVYQLDQFLDGAAGGGGPQCLLTAVGCQLLAVQQRHQPGHVLHRAVRRSGPDRLVRTVGVAGRPGQQGDQTGHVLHGAAHPDDAQNVDHGPSVFG
ncbi:hypothetical protein SHIRM173S_04820 [Streptomyces hirsutus]